MQIKFGVRLPNTAAGGRSAPSWEKVDYGTIRDAVLEYERLGFDSIWVADHLVGLPGARTEDTLEGWTVLSSLANITERIRLGTLVLCNAFRYPSLVAKMSSTLDVISKGRLEIGIGAGAVERDFQAYGIPWYDNSTRLKMMRESIIIIKKLWTESITNFEGKYNRLKNCFCEPKPLQKPHPPLWIGGGGEKITLKIAAELADGCGFPAPNTSVEAYKHKLDVLREHCTKVGRDCDELKKFWGGCIIISDSEQEVKEMIKKFQPLDNKFKGIPEEEYRKKYLIGTSEECVKRVQEYADLGVTNFLLWFSDFPSMTQARLFAKRVIPLFR